MDILDIIYVYKTVEKEYFKNKALNATDVRHLCENGIPAIDFLMKSVNWAVFNECFLEWLHDNANHLYFKTSSIDKTFYETTQEDKENLTIQCKNG